MKNLNFDDHLEEIQHILGYRFREPSLAQGALTRRSYWHENRETCDSHNERMEFLGDAVLGLVIADILYQEFPEEEEGELQKKRAGLVNRATLARMLRRLGLGRFIRMGRGDDISGCRDRDSVLADTFEALVAAVYLDGGFEQAAAVIRRHFGPQVELCRTNEWTEDFKSLLQERTQADRGITPNYEVVEESGEDHSKTFVVAVYLGDRMIGQGTGRNKKEAAQKAARAALEACESFNEE